MLLLIFLAGIIFNILLVILNNLISSDDWEIIGLLIFIPLSWAGTVFISKNLIENIIDLPNRIKRKKQYEKQVRKNNERIQRLQERQVETDKENLKISENFDKVCKTIAQYLEKTK
jgi:predicted PurR-regulated permease PerM